mmetsp:Transcript_5967/g.19468  ORF Transcript_5967/g.19468 Transcript_5967/m.19468 type:complete len:214 (+) Transcript_5967:810-1451(+)
MVTASSVTESSVPITTSAQVTPTLAAPYSVPFRWTAANDCRGALFTSLFQMRRSQSSFSNRYTTTPGHRPVATRPASTPTDWRFSMYRKSVPRRPICTLIADGLPDAVGPSAVSGARVTVKLVVGSDVSWTSHSGDSQPSCSRIGDVSESGPYPFSWCIPWAMRPSVPIPLLLYDVSYRSGRLKECINSWMAVPAPGNLPKGVPVCFSDARAK